MSIRVEEYNGPADEWDDFTRSQDGWTHFHLWGWRNVIQQVFGHECPYLAARDGEDRLVGVVPLVRVHSLLFGRHLVSMPFVNYGGPLGSEAAVTTLAEGAVETARAGRSKFLELRSRTRLPVPLRVSHRKITVLLDLPSDGPDALWDSFRSKVRSQIRRPKKEGVTIRFGTDQIEPFYEVFARHMRDLGTPVQPRSLFEALAAEFPEDAWFGCAYLGEQPVACGAGLRWGSEFEMTWASALREHSRIAPNMLLYWAFMKRAMESGARTFNFGRCTPESGTHRFKRQWGSRDEPLWWYQHSDSGVEATPSPDDDAYAWGPRLWQRLPLSLATRLGPRIVRSIP